MLKMGGLVEVNIMDAAKALEDRDFELAEKVRGRDKQIDDLEEELVVEQEVEEEVQETEKSAEQIWEELAEKDPKK